MTQKTPRPRWAENERIGGYRLLRSAPLPSLSSVFYELVHEKTGARHIHLENENPENTFAVAFKTVPSDSTGVAHILEHTALCGSRKFPVRDPFFSMIRRSLQSFMNAFTAPDWTMYPFCTANPKDFGNLLSVYLDAAFFPLLSELSFKQEGWRLEPAGPDPAGPLAVKGVVYNEMKGAMSSPDQIMGRAMMAALFPDTTYGQNSGGDPERIPELSHEGLLAFHRRHYHPSNAWFYTFGNLPLERNLDFIEREVLSHFDRINPGTEVPSQPRFSAPRRAETPYPLAPEADNGKKNQFALAWLAAPITEAAKVPALAMLEKILLGHPASPLRKALMESGLGSALADSTGYDPELRDTLFSCGLKDVARDATDSVASLVMDTLSALAREGLPRELAETALHQYEFARRELTNSPFSWGLKLCTGFCAPWLHGADPLRILDFDQDLAEIRRGASDSSFFPGLIRDYLLENQHRVDFLLYPDPELLARREKMEAGLIERYGAALTAAEREKIARDTAALAALQETPEDLSCLPTVTVSDVPPEVPVTRPDPAMSRDALSAYPAATNGILYLSLAARLSALPAELLPLAPFFCHAFSRCGSQKRGYAELSGLIAAKTGGLSLAVSSHLKNDEAASPLELAVLDMKCLARNLDPALDLVSELVFEHSFSDLARLKVLVSEYAAHLSSGVVAAGHRYAMSLAARGWNRSRGISETWFGIHQVRRMKELARDLSGQKLEKLASDLALLGSLIFSRKNVTAGIVGAEDLLPRASAFFEGLRAKMPEGSAPTPADPGLSAFAPVDREGWHTSASVSFSAHCLKGARFTSPDAPVLAVAAHLLKGRFLHTEIREKGGAYGSFAVASPEDGLFFMASYRDPHVARTLETFRRAYGFLAEGDFSADDVADAVLQTAAEIDRPQTPAESARRSFFRDILGVSDADRQAFKDRLLSVTSEKIRAAASAYFPQAAALPSPAVTVGSLPALEAANAELPGHPLSLHAID